MLKLDCFKLLYNFFNNKYPRRSSAHADAGLHDMSQIRRTKIGTDVGRALAMRENKRY